jgi:hypothetical protein
LISPLSIHEKSSSQAKSQTPLAFSTLNLRFNPFGEVPCEMRASLAVVDTAPLLAWLEQPRSAVQVIGGQGFGKTTTLIALLPDFPAATYHHLKEGEPARVPIAETLFLDEAQRAGNFQLWRRLRKTTRLVIGSHVSHRRTLRLRGFRVMTYNVETQLNPERLAIALNRRIELARRAAGRLPLITISTAEQLFARFDGNCRAIESHLYQTFQHLKEIVDV